MTLLTIFVSIWLISLWVYFRRGRSAMRAVVICAGLHIVVMGLIWGGPISSGALFLLLPARSSQPASPDALLAYAPLHTGHVDLATGLYVREDEDIILSREPWFIWRRTYLSRDRVKRHLGIGTTHNAEWYLMGDHRNLKRIQLIRDDGTRIVFDRTSSGTSYGNALLVHTATATGFYGAQLGWVGQRWALRFADGVLAMFKACDTADNPCSLISVRDRQGRVVRFNRDERGMLRTIDAGGRRLTFGYDERNRVVRAVAGQDEATYSYDGRGRLERAIVGGIARSYRYGSRDEMIAIDEPDRSIENTYDDNLRVIRQVLRRSGRPDTVHSFAYTVYDNAVIETAVTRPNGSRTTYRWNENRYADLEIYEGSGESPVTVQYARADGLSTNALTISCTKGGRPVSETVEVWPGEEPRVKHEVIGRICSE